MSRFLAVSALLLACTKAPANQEPATGAPPGGDTGGGPGKIAVPGGGGNEEGVRGTVGGGNTVDNARNRLTAEEGKLSVVSPTDAKANAEAIVKISVTPSSAYKVNTEFPTKLTLDTTNGITLAKAELKAGGHDQAKGDAEEFSEKELVFAVKLTPSASGSYTINGSFKFAVCDKAGSTCLAKKEPIAIQVAAK
jgi:hypothetical protein